MEGVRVVDLLQHRYASVIHQNVDRAVFFFDLIEELFTSAALLMSA
jgi:hypothetical protein